MMKYALPLLFLLVPLTLFGQEMNHKVIKKSKKRSLNTFATIQSATATTSYKYATYTFNDDGHVQSEITYDAEGKETINYQATIKDGRLSQSEKKKAKFNELEKIIYTYDEAGNLLKKAEYRDGKLIIYYQHFYTDNRLDSIIWYTGNNEAQLFEYYTYENGKLKTITEKTSYGRLDGKTDIYYHEDGTLKEEKLYDGFGEMYEHISYNKKGWMTEKKIIQDKTVILLTYRYNGKGLLKKGTKSVSDDPNTIQYTYKWTK